jgi:nitric oxide reductase subunit B
MKYRPEILFIVTGLMALIAGLAFGVLSAFQFVWADSFLKDFLPFYKVRPLHVTLVISWILMSATGGVYYYLIKINRSKPLSNFIPYIHYFLFLLSGIGIITSFYMGHFSGREYFEFPMIFFYPIFAGWLLFAVYVFSSVTWRKSPMPVYMWMWMLGSVFMIYSLMEANLWRLPVINQNIIRDMTIQWKSYGSMVGAWNMLVYGTATFVMCRIKNNNDLTTQPLTYFLFFLGLTNLMFNWGHHIYVLPKIKHIQVVSYFISMTELLILAKIIRDWRKSLSVQQISNSGFSYKIIRVSEIWVFLNLALALMISIPLINVYTHGTHVTVAHAMGTTIGINSFILMGSVYYIAFRNKNKSRQKRAGTTLWGLRITHVSLLVFWFSLITAGVTKGYFQIQTELPFREIMDKLTPLFILFSVAGVGVLIGMMMLAYPVLMEFWANRNRRTSG